MFDSFENKFDTEQHRFSEEQRIRYVENIVDFVVYLVSEDSLIIDRDGSAYIHLDSQVYGDDTKHNCHSIEEYLDDNGPSSQPLLIVKTPDGFVVDASEVYAENFKYFESISLTETERNEMAPIIAFSETVDGADAMIELVEDYYNVSLIEQFNTQLKHLDELQQSKYNE